MTSPSLAYVSSLKVQQFNSVIKGNLRKTLCINKSHLVMYSIWTIVLPQIGSIYRQARCLLPGQLAWNGKKVDTKHIGTILDFTPSHKFLLHEGLATLCNTLLPITNHVPVL